MLRLHIGLGMKKVRDLIAKASKDFELAKRHKSIKEYVTATVLYNKAVEKVLKALFISKTKRDPPENASIEYLARRTGVPAEISVYITSVQENAESMEPAEFIDMTGEANEKSAEREAFYMDGLARRLLDYVSAYVKV